MSANDQFSGQPSTLASATRLLLERWWVIALCAIIGASFLFGFDKRKTELYAASATLLFNAPSVNVTGVVNANASSATADPQRDQGTTLLLVTSNTVAERVRRVLRDRATAGELAAAVSASAAPDANLINVNAVDPDPRRAALLANAFAEQYKEFRQQSDRQGYAQSIQEIQQLQAQLPSTAQSQRAQYRTTLGELELLRAASNGAVQVVSRATAPTVPSSPRPKRDALLGLLLGLAVGAVIVFALDAFDRRLKTIASFERAYGLVALASVGLHRSGRAELDRRALLEPYRILRSGLVSLSGAGDLQVILVTSAVSGEGKSTSAVGLARAFALAGSRVVLVEMDMRRPTFHQRFDLGADARGLATVLIERIPAVEVARSSGDPLAELDVLPAGGTPERSAELLGSPAMSRVLDDLAAAYDVVILDAPPLLPVADTRALLDHRRIDACLVVGRSHSTTRDQAGRAQAILGQHRVRNLGLIVNGVRASQLPDDYAYDDLDSDRGAAGRPTLEHDPPQRARARARALAREPR